MMESLRSVHAEPASARGLLSIYKFSPEKNRWTRTQYARAAITPAPSSFHVLTWNVDFMAPEAGERLKCALDHMQNVVFSCSSGEAPEPCVVLLQEIEAEAIPVLLTHDWVRAHFQVTPISQWNWPNRAHYGNITLVARSVPLIGASSLVFANSHMSRNALIVDVLVDPPKTLESATGAHNVSGNIDASSEPHAVTVRIANVHLESLPQGSAARPQQLALVAQALTEPGLLGGIVCGDMNAINPKIDKDIPKEVGLRDAYDGSEDDADGHTWGYQPVCNYAPARLDKVLYTPGKGLSVEKPKRVGPDLKTGRGRWASDHFGLLTYVKITCLVKVKDSRNDAEGSASAKK